MHKTVLRSIAAIALCAAGSLAHAQAWPGKPIRWVVPYGPGSTDILARLLAPTVSTALGQQIVVENRPGAGGSVGSAQVAKTDPDGYTLLLGAAASHAVNPALLSKIGYDAAKDFTPIVNLASIPNVVIVNPQLPVKSIAELVAAAKAKPGGLLYSSNGPGTSQHMSAALFEMLAGVKMEHVPYKGSSEGVVAVTRGDVSLMFANLPPAMPLIKDGRVKPIAVTTARRLPAFPDLPTVAESGVPGYEVATWFALFAPAGLPEPITQRLNREFNAALNAPDIREKLQNQGFTINGGSSQDLARLVSTELTKWARVVKESGAKAD
jgi:tripartite-type tricarboxylate transporter receptor subunit TctC